MKEREKSRVLVFLLCLIIIGQAAMDIYLPSIPRLVSLFAAPVEQVQMTISIYLLGFGISQIFYGPLADRFGRLPVLLVGLPFFSAASVAMMWAPSINWVLALRFVQGISIGAASVCARAIMRDVFEADELPVASSYMSMAWALVPILAPTLGGAIQLHFGWSYSFLLLGVVGVGLTCWLVIGIGETNRHRTSTLSVKEITRNYASLFDKVEFRNNMILLSLLYGIFSIVNVAGPIVFQSQYHFSTMSYGWTMLIISFGYLAGSFLNNRLLVRMRSGRIVGVGTTLLFVTCLVNLIFELCGLRSPLTLICVLFSIYLALGLVFANALSASLRPFPHLAGLASSMYGLLMFCSGSLISSGYATFLTSNSISLACAVLVLGALMFACHIIFSRNSGDTESGACESRNAESAIG